MKQGPDQSSRQFLLSLAGVITLIADQSDATSFRSGLRIESPLTAGWLNIDIEYAAHIGKRIACDDSYVKLTTTLKNGIRRVAPDFSWQREYSKNEICRILRAASKLDFENGDTAFVERWVISRTEAQVCALAALTI